MNRYWVVRKMGERNTPLYFTGTFRQVSGEASWTHWLLTAGKYSEVAAKEIANSLGAEVEEIEEVLS